MKYLLDTHTVLWFAENSERLSQTAKEIILNPAHEKYVSIASAWEIAIKISLKKITLEGGVKEFFRMIDKNSFILFSIVEAHIQKVAELPFHHRDPFDRVLIASAIVEKMRILSADTYMPLYGVPCEW